jgi:hypothetical protein
MVAALARFSGAGRLLARADRTDCVSLPISPHNRSLWSRLVGVAGSYRNAFPDGRASLTAPNIRSVKPIPSSA